MTEEDTLIATPTAADAVQFASPKEGEMIALADTWLKKYYDRQATMLPDDQRHAVKKGESWGIDSWEEADARLHSDHAAVKLKANSGSWFIYLPHWQMPSMILFEAPSKLPKASDVDWHDNRCPVSKYFTVGEVINNSDERRPIRGDGEASARDIQNNIIAIARKMDKIREWWGGPLGVNSWYRPWAVNRRIGSRAPNHPSGYAVDFRPLNGSVWDLQNRFKKEWYDAGKWEGGFGLGARKGFVHLDLRGKRTWNY